MESAGTLQYDCADPPREIIELRKPLDIGISTQMLTSPNFGDDDYPNNILCIYKVSECRNSTDGQMLQWEDNTFELEAENNFFTSFFCSDLVELVDLPVSRRDLTIENDVVLESITPGRFVLCGDQCGVDEFFSGRTTQVSTNY